MSTGATPSFKALLRRVLDRYHSVLGGLFFIVGFTLRLVSTFYFSDNLIWQIAGDFGTFLAGAIAIPFVYDRFIRNADRRVFLSDMQEVFDLKLKEILGVGVSPKYHEHGRLQLKQQVDFFKDSRSEVTQIGVALRTLTGYFYQRPANDFRDVVEDLMKRGVDFNFVLLKPDSEIAKQYAADREEPDLVENIRKTVESLRKLRDEYNQAGWPGSFKVFIYSHIPSCYVMLIDSEEDEGRALVSQYLCGVKRADTPIMEVYKSRNQVLFNKYKGFVTKMISGSTEI